MAERFACVPSTSQTRSLLSDEPPPDFESLRRLLLKRCGGRDDGLASLRISIVVFNDFMRKSSPPVPRFDFFTDLLPHIHSWALAYPVEVPILRAGSSSHAALSRGTIRTILSNAFFLNVLPFRDAPTCGVEVSTGGLCASPSATTGYQSAGASIKPYDRAPQLGNISFIELYSSTQSLAVQRLLCMLAYFESARHFQPQELEEEVCFERHILPESNLPNWESLNMRINTNAVRIHAQIMESSDAKGIMDFANKALHIHEIIPSATQEEILFSTCPEAFPGVLFCDILTDREVIIIRNVRRLVQYKGYASTFKFEGLYPAIRIHDIIAADATYRMHFSKPMTDRDLNKAYLAFCAASSSTRSLPSMKVSTSHWGCGAFRGDKHHKFLQQVCASTLAGIQLDYSTFGDHSIAKSFNGLLDLISSRQHTIGSVYRAMSGYQRDAGVFSDYIFRNLDEQSLP